MERIPTSAPQIPSLPSSQNRPLWSVMIPVCNCAKFLPEALLSVLAQDPGESQMQIEVVDDASTDADIEAMVKFLGKGRVDYFRQPENIGSLRNFETCINRSRGKLMHLLHGDDRVKSGFYEKIAMLFDRYPEAGAAFCSYSFINESGQRTHDHPPEAEKEGILKNWLIRIAERQRIQYVAMAVRREVYENLGSFYGMTYGEDWEMWVRIARYYPVAYTPEILAEYRGHLGSLTWEKAVSGKIFKDLLHTMKFIQAHVPEKDRRRVLVKSKKHCANFLIGMAGSVWKRSQSLPLAQAQIQQALAFSKNPRLLSRILKLYVKIIRDVLKKICAGSYI